MKHFVTFVIAVVLCSGAWAQDRYTNGENLRLGYDGEYLAPAPPQPKFIHEGRIRRHERKRQKANRVINKIHHVLDLVSEFVNTE